MRMTPEEFEKWMVRLDNDPTVDTSERKLILRKMSECKTRAEFNDFIKSIEIKERIKEGV